MAAESCWPEEIPPLILRNGGGIVLAGREPRPGCSTRLVLAKGGLCNGITQRIEQRPFSLSDTAAYLLSRNVKLSAQ
jgi:hypothetical protein